MPATIVTHVTTFLYYSRQFVFIDHLLLVSLLEATYFFLYVLGGMFHRFFALTGITTRDIVSNHFCIVIISPTFKMCLANCFIMIVMVNLH